MGVWCRGVSGVGLFYNFVSFLLLNWKYGRQDFCGRIGVCFHCVRVVMSCSLVEKKVGVAS